MLADLSTYDAAGGAGDSLCAFENFTLSGNQTDWIEPTGVDALVSVVVPTCNRPKLLGETLRAFIEQSYRPVEIVVVDDGTPEQGAEATVAALRDKAPDGITFTYVRNENSGAPSARNTGAKKTRGEFIVFMDDDDVVAVDFLTARIAALEADESASFAYGPWIRFFPKGDEYQLIDYKGSRRPEASSPWVSLMLNWDLLLQGCVIRRSFASDVGPWRVGLKKSQDLDYKAKMMADEDCRPVYTPNGPVFYRLHQESISRSLTSEKLDSHLDALDEIEAMAVERPDYEETKDAISEFLYFHSFWLYGVGDFSRAGRLLRRAKVHAPDILRKKGKLSRLLDSVGLTSFVGPLYYLVSRFKRYLGLSETRIEAVTKLLPTKQSVELSA